MIFNFFLRCVLYFLCSIKSSQLRIKIQLCEKQRNENFCILEYYIQVEVTLEFFNVKTYTCKYYQLGISYNHRPPMEDCFNWLLLFTTTETKQNRTKQKGGMGVRGGVEGKFYKAIRKDGRSKRVDLEKVRLKLGFSC